jgi:hypothetical protein
MKLKTTHNIVSEKNSGQVELAKYTFKDVVEQKLTRDFLPDQSDIDCAGRSYGRIFAKKYDG